MIIVTNGYQRSYVSPSPLFKYRQSGVDSTSQHQRLKEEVCTNCVNRTNVPSDPQNNMNAAEGFFLLLLHTHVIAAANTIMKFNPQTSVSDLAKMIIVNYVHLPQADSTEKYDPAADAGNADDFTCMPTELLTLSILWHGFHDSIKGIGF